MPLPNFLLAGPTKCGTTSLAEYIGQHPEIFMPAQKEPRFLSSQLVEFPLLGPGADKVEDWYVKDIADYEALYNGSESYKIVGDASADTLYYGEDMVKVINKYLGKPKIIIVLRDPTSRAFSAFQHLVRDNREPLGFREALEAEEERIRDNWDPLYHYKAVSMYSKVVETFINSFPEVLILFTSEIANQEETFRKIFTFLGVDPEFKVDSSVQHNQSGKPKSQFINDFLGNDGKLRKALRPIIQFFIPASARQRIVSSIQAKNLTRMEIDEEMAIELRNYFEPDIRNLENVIGKDLSHWYSVTSHPQA